MAVETHTEKDAVNARGGVGELNYSQVGEEMV